MSGRTARGSLGIAVAAIAVAPMLGACGSAAHGTTPNPASVPLTSRARIVAAVQQCDKGASAYCATELVVVDPSYTSSVDLMTAERRRLRSSGWALADGDTGDEQAADSPGHKLRLTFATAAGDLEGVDLTWIQRPRSIALALSKTIFMRTAALSLMLETGS